MKGFGVNVLSCRFGIIYFVVGILVIGMGEINCVILVYVVGVVFVSVFSFDLGLTVLIFEYIFVFIL